MLPDRSNNNEISFICSFLEEVFESKQKSKQWYFSKIRSLGNKRPYDLCKEGKHKKIEKALTAIEHGICL